MQSGRAFYAGLLEALIEVMGLAKGYLRDHGAHVAMLSTQIGKGMGLDAREQARVFFGAILSDIGMIGLAEDAWENPVPELPPEVRARVARHPGRSERRVAGIPHLEELAPLVRHHHEWWDGSGYPDALSGAEIPLGAQILRLADTVAALQAPRPHRPALSEQAIIDIVEQGAGREFGPEVTDCYLSLQRNGDISLFDATAFRHRIARSAAEVIPEEVSPLSIDHLLVILAHLIDAKDPYTAGHSSRVASLGVAVAAELGVGQELEDALWAGGYLHDLGKLGVPLRVLTKRERLDDEEFAAIKAHPVDGALILEGIPALKHLTTGARYHHERWDGRGYPEGIKGEHIPLVAQVMAVCDAYDAMTSRRAYRESRGHAVAVAEIARDSGTHFSPRAADAFLSLPKDVVEQVRVDAEEASEAAPPSGGARRPRRSRDVSSVSPSL